MGRFRRWTVAGLAALVLCGSLAISSPAQAGPDTGFVAGAGVTWDDFDDEATLCNGCAYWRSNYTAFWQMILWLQVDEATAQDVDCEFGPRTEYLTRLWQQRYLPNGPVNGRVDYTTRNTAAIFLWRQGSDGVGGDYVWYTGLHGNIMAIHRRNSSAGYRYDVRSIFNTDEWHGASYHYANYSFCA